MTRENAQAKGMRYLTEARLCVTSVRGDEVAAQVRGDSGEVYHCGHSQIRGGWFCECPAKTRCAHLYAVMSVTVRNRKETP